MKINKIIAIIIFLLPQISFAQGFRSTEWGMNREQVKSTEKGPFNESGPYISVLNPIDINGVSFMILYEFENNKLITGSYMGLDALNIDSAINSFSNLTDLLDEKYGDAVVHDFYDDKSVERVYKGKSEYWSSLLEKGMMYLVCAVAAKGTAINMMLEKSSDNELKIMIYYSGLSTDEITKKNAMSDL